MAGTVTLTGVEGEASLYAENGMSRTLVATFDASEPYSYSLPALATRLVAEADGYYDAAASVTEAGGDVSLSTERIAFGKNENIPEGYRGDLSQWDFGAYKTDGVIRSLTTGNYVRASYNNAYSTNVFLSSNIVMAQGVTDRRHPRGGWDPDRQSPRFLFARRSFLRLHAAGKRTGSAHIPRGHFEDPAPRQQNTCAFSFRSEGIHDARFCIHEGGGIRLFFATRPLR